MNNSNGNLRVITLSSSDHSFGVRDDHGFRCFLPKVHHYTGQDERYEKEKADIEAFANLFASAPDLLSMLERIEHLHRDGFDIQLSVFQEIRSLIQKAKGETK